ncbi:hypothetical protein ACX28W_07280 [Streptomyces sp. SD15]
MDGSFPSARPAPPRGADSLLIEQPVHQLNSGGFRHRPPQGDRWRTREATTYMVHHLGGDPSDVRFSVPMP